MGIRLALCQSKASVGDVRTNLNRIMSVISQNRSDVYVFPELFLTGYGADYASLADDIQYAADKVRIWCIEKNIAVAVGSPSWYQDGMRNSLLFITPDGVTKYDKLYPANFGVYSEKEFIPGNMPKTAVFGGMKFGFSICYDIFFPEICRNCALSGAYVNLCIAASAASSKPYFDRILPARSLENVMYTVFVNNVGNFEGSNAFFGHSRLIGPLGSTITELGDEEETVCIYLDQDVIDNARKERKHMDDLRIDIRWVPD
ncbi:MAG: carbon-nitrogen hydrolase family protein [Candidatus Methanoplasma sp.]|jgi:predicted amidohydrolase|nr:carbon-nitrogen hydrolase family protein [Candidatus Methanoplasma sp.]